MVRTLLMALAAMGVGFALSASAPAQDKKDGPPQPDPVIRLAGPDQVRTLLAELARRRAGQDDINAGERDEAGLVEVGAGLP